MQLTKNFTLAELTRSATAAKLGIRNIAPAVYVNNLQVLCEQVLQPLRDHFRQAIRVTSGYRSPALNAAVGGAKGSQHCLGQAADIKPNSTFNSQQSKLIMMRWFVWLMDNLPFDQLIWEKSGQWIHVSYRADGKNRQQVILQ